MGREIRKVPKGWEHPKDGRGRYIPLRGESYKEELNKWEEDKRRFEAIGPNIHYSHSMRPDGRDHVVDFDGQRYLIIDDPNIKTFEDWDGNRPDPEDYRPDWSAEEATCFQWYENTSEGTPLSPVFAHLSDLEDYIVRVGDPVFGPISREAAHEFCRERWAPSMTHARSRGLQGGIEGFHGGSKRGPKTA